MTFTAAGATRLASGVGRCPAMCLAAGADAGQRDARIDLAVCAERVNLAI